MVTVCPSQFATRRTLFHVLVGCGLLMLKVSRLKLPVIWLLVSMWLNTLTKSQIRSEERRVGKECRSRWGPDAQKKRQSHSTAERTVGSAEGDWVEVVGANTAQSARTLRSRPPGSERYAYRCSAPLPAVFFFQAEDGIRARSRHSC